MKNTNLTLLSLSIAILSLTACGGGSSSEAKSPDNNPSVSTPTPTQIEGGAVNSPAQMEHRLPHIISNDDAHNYFKVSVQSGQRIVIFSNLDMYLDDQSFARCSASPMGYHTGISLVGTNATACANNFEHTFDFSGEAVFRFGYPYNNSGVFVYSIVGDVDDAEILDANGDGGLPDSPRRINVAGNNIINSNNLLNYFVYEGVTGETITLNAYLNDSIGEQDQSRCTSSIGSESLENHYTYGFAVNNRQYNCADELSYTFTQNGITNIHVKYIKNISGYFIFSSVR